MFSVKGNRALFLFVVASFGFLLFCQYIYVFNVSLVHISFTAEHFTLDRREIASAAEDPSLEQLLSGQQAAVVVVGDGAVATTSTSSSTSTSTSSPSSSVWSTTTPSNVIATNRTLSEATNATKLSSSASSSVVSEEAEEETNTSTTTTLPPELPLCPEKPPKLVGRLKVLLEAKEWPEIEAEHGSSVTVGGRHRPSECKARHKVAIIIPYRDRMEQLKVFLYYMHPILVRQQLDYGIYVVNQAGTTKFNRAMLFNVGYVEAKKDYDYDCYIFHDVDLLPEDDRNLYTCPEMPRHMSVAVDTLKYKLPYKSIFGGVCALTDGQMKAVNGFSNQFWGWGGEDDDMWRRISNQHMNVTRYDAAIARYTMIKHKKEKPSDERHKLLKKGKLYYERDGLNNLQYNLVGTERHPMYTMLNVVLFKVAPAKREKGSAKLAHKADKAKL